MTDFADFESENRKKDLSDMDVFAEQLEYALDTDDVLSSSPSSLSSASPDPIKDNAAVSADIRHIIDLTLSQIIEFRAKGKNVVFSELPDISKLQAESEEKIPRYLQSEGLMALEGKRSLTEPLSALQKVLPDFFGQFKTLLPVFNDEGRGLSYLTAISSASGEQHRFAYRKVVEASPDLIRSGRLDDDEKVNYKLRKHASALCEHIESTWGLLDTINGNLPHFLPWTELEARELRVLRDILFVTEDKHNPRDKLDAFGKLNEQDKKNMMVKDPELAALLKMNSFMNYAGWDERRDRQKLVSGVTKSAAQLRTSIKLTRGSAQNLVKQYKKRMEPNVGLDVLADNILAVCEPLEKLVDALEDQSKSALPSEEMRREYGDDTNPQYINREVTNFRAWKESPFPKMVTLPVKKLDTSINSLEHKAKSLTNKEEAPGTETAVFRVGIILSYRLQQLARNIAIMKRDSALLQMAMERKAVAEKLPKSPLFTTKLDLALESLSEDWQKKIEQQRDELQASLDRMALLADEDKRPIFLEELRNILRAAPDDPTSRKVISKFDAFTVECVNDMGKVEKALVSQVTDILTAPEKRKAGFQVALAKWQADLDGLQHSLETGLKRYTGRSLNNFSRGAMIAKGLAVRLQKNKQAYLKTVGEAERGEAGTQYDTLVHSIMEEEYLPLFAKGNDVAGELFLQRFELEMKNAEDGNIIYPTTMAEILSGMKSPKQSIREWAKNQLVMRGVFRHIIRGVSLIPQALSVPVSLGYRIAIRGGTIAVMYVTVKYRGEGGIRLGLGGIGQARNTWLRETLKVGALKTFISSVPGLPLLVGLDTIRLEIEEGGDPVDILLDSGKAAFKALPMQGFHHLRRDVFQAWRTGRHLKEWDAMLEKFRAPTTDPGKERLSTLSARDKLERIAESKNPALADSAKRLQAISKRKAFPVRIQESSHQIVSSFDLKTHTITLRKGATDEEILHEIAHALSAYLVRIGREEPDSPLGKTVKALDDLRERALKSYRELHGSKDDEVRHHLENLDEFIAGLYSGDSEFRRFLHSIDPQGRSLLVKFVALLCELLMLDTERESALRHAQELSETIMGHSLSDYEMRRYEGKLNYSPPGTSFKIGVKYSRQTSTDRPQASTTSSAIDWQTFNGRKTSDPSQRDALVSWLAALTPQARRAWFSSRTLTLDRGFVQDLNIYLAEKYFIYDDLVSGADYFAWVNQFKQWPAAFQRDNRVVGILRDVRSPADFPAGKGFLFTLRDGTGGIIFSKKYFPDASAANSNQSGLWHKNILEQIASDMDKLPEELRISISHITAQSYGSQQPVLGQGATANHQRNIFIAAPDSQVATADFRFVDATENIVPISEELEKQEGEQENELQSQPREEQSDPLVGAGKVSDYFLEKESVSADIRQDTLVWTTITGSDIDPDERNEAYNAFVYLWQPGKPGRIRVTTGQYLNEDAYLDSRYQMMILPRDYTFADENSAPTEDDRRWPSLETLYRSRHIRLLHQRIFAEASDDDAEAASSLGENEPVAERKTHTQGTKSWETDNQQCFPLQGERDLVAGEKILVSVTDEQGLVEYIEIIVPATKLGRHRWPAYVAAKINSEMKFVRVGDQGQSASIDVKTSGKNYLWTTNGQVVEWQIFLGGTAAALPAEDNVRWRVPASDTWASTPPRLVLPRPASVDERLVIWVEDKKSGALIECLEVPAMQEPNEKALGQEINQNASHLRVGGLSKGVVAPTDNVGGNIFWVDNDDYVVKYALVPAESLDKNLQLQQRYQLLDQLQRNPTETREFMASGKHHPYTALDRTEINRLLAIPPSGLRDEVARLFVELREAKLSPQQMDSERWSYREKTLINDSLSFRTRQPLLASAAENKSFAKAKTDALRYFLHKYPNLAEGTEISAITVDPHQLLAVVNNVYAKMTQEQQNYFIFVTALNWKLATDASFSSRIASLTSGTTLGLFGLREEVITEYETAVSKEIFVNYDSKAVHFKSRSESSSDEEYFKQFADYIKDNLSDEAKRMSRFQISQSGLSSFDMNRPVARNVKITMNVPVYVQSGLQRNSREKPVTGDIHLFKTDSGRYFIYSSVGESVFLQEVKDNFSETELTNMLNGRIDNAVAIKLEALFRQKIPLDDVSTQGGYGSYNSTKRSADGPSTHEYSFNAQVESPQELQSKLATANSAYLNSAVAQYREQQFTLNNWEKLRDAIIPFYKRWSRSSKDPTYEHSDEDAYNDLMNLFGLFSVVGSGSGGAAKAFRSIAGVLSSGRPATARAMLSLLVRGAQAAAPGLKEALRGMAVQLASEMFPPLDLARAARAGGGYVRKAIGRTGGVSGLRNIAEGSSQSVASRNPFSPQNRVSVDLSDAARYQPSGHNSVNAPNNLYIKDGQIYLQRSDGVFELDAPHGGRTLRVRVPGQTPYTGPEIIHTSNGFIAKRPSGLGGGKNGGSRILLGDNRGQPIRGTLGRERYGQNNLLSKPRGGGPLLDQDGKPLSGTQRRAPLAEQDNFEIEGTSVTGGATSASGSLQPKGTLDEFPNSLRKTDVDLNHIRQGTGADRYRGVYTDASVTPSKYYIKQDEHVFEVTFDSAGSTWRLDDSTPVYFNNDTGWEYPAGTELGARRRFPSIRSKAKSDIQLNGRTYRNHDAINSQAEELTSIKTRYEIDSTATSAQEQTSRDFEAGIHEYNNEKSRQFDNLSLREKIERLSSTSPNNQLTHRQKGALWQKAHDQFWEDQAHKQIIKGQEWYDSARKNYNATGGEVSPQGAYLRGKKGECEPATILMAHAQRQGRGDEMARSLMDLYDNPNNALGTSLASLRGRPGVKGEVINGVKLSELKKSERTLFPSRTTTSVRLELKKGGEATRNHVVLLSRREYVPGNYIYSYFDPNYGYVEFSKHSDMAGFVKKQVQLKSKANGGYKNSDEDVEFSTVSDQNLNSVTHDIPTESFMSTKKISVNELDENINRASTPDPSGYSQICYRGAINDAKEARVINSQEHNWLINSVARRDARGEIMGSDNYRQAFDLQNKPPMINFAGANINESGFMHVGERRADGSVHYDHVVYVHVDNSGTYLYQVNGSDFLEKMNGADKVGTNNNIGKHVSKSHYKHKMDESRINSFNEYFAPVQNGSQSVFTFTPASQVKRAYIRTVLA